MNIHAPLNSKEEFPQWEFRGKRFYRKGQLLIKAKEKQTGYSYYYNFSLDLFARDVKSFDIF